MNVLPNNRCTANATGLAAIAILFALAGCATTPAHKPASDVGTAWKSRKQLLSHLRMWRLHASIGVQLKQQAWHGGIDWTQRANRFKLDLLSPFGRTVAKLRGGPGGVVLTTAKGKRATAGDSEALMKRMLGFSLPLSGLRYWALGIPQPNVHHTRRSLDDYGRLRRLSQLGWQVHYHQYQPALATSLPERIELRNDNVKVKMLIKKWQPITE